MPHVSFLKVDVDEVEVILTKSTDFRHCRSRFALEQVRPGLSVAPLWDEASHQIPGMLTSSDFILILMEILLHILLKMRHFLLSIVRWMLIHSKMSMKSEMDVIAKEVEVELTSRDFGCHLIEVLETVNKVLFESSNILDSKCSYLP
ncbi:hypothetical protein L1987_87887 [Smallanthus sonchifolius]|nr:hypothetical protein L1987_87887 [Smallanthus sonchifolius]